MSKNHTKDGRIEIEEACAICCSFDNIVAQDKLIKSHLVGGNTYLLVCISCYNSSITALILDNTSNTI